MYKVVYILKKILPQFLYNWLKIIYKTLVTPLSNLLFKIKLKRIQDNHLKALEVVRRKEKIKVAFFLIHEAVWKYDELYKLMDKDKRFDPIIVICPSVTYGEEVMHKELNKTYKAFKQKGLNVINTYDRENGEWLDVNKEINPDIIFFTNPYNLTHQFYLIDSFKNKLTCYVPYNFGNSHMIEMFHNMRFHNLLWRFYVETNYHQQLSKSVAINKGENTVITGYPGLDSFLFNNDEVNDKNLWKNEDLIKIIWAPHHTIDDNKKQISFSSFLLYHEFMIQLLNNYRDKIEIIFKPHPLLRAKLYNKDGWGKERTDKYYMQWSKFGNSGLHEGFYEDLFKTSDAMIHDSGSFLIEYLTTGKPVLRTDRDPKVTERLNQFAKEAYRKHYIASNKDDIEKFILQLVKKEDPLKTERIGFVQNKLIPKDKKKASYNIFTDLRKALS